MSRAALSPDEAPNDLQPDKETADNKTTAAPLEYWRSLAQLAREEQLVELEVERDGVRVTLRAASATQAATAPLFFSGAMPSSAMPAADAPPSTTVQVGMPVTSTPAVRDENLIEIVSPMVGMFYRAPSPSDSNFVEIGDKVEVGQTVALVEAMKVFNEITSEVAGTVSEIISSSGDLVETGQPLIIIRR